MLICAQPSRTGHRAFLLSLRISLCETADTARIEQIKVLQYEYPILIQHKFKKQHATTMPSSLVNILLFKPPLTKRYRIPSEIYHVQTSFGNQIAVTHIHRRGSNVTLLFSHGNAEDLNSAYYWMKKLSKELDVNVVGYDYTGYGENDGECRRPDCYIVCPSRSGPRAHRVYIFYNLKTGSPSEIKCYADIEAVYQDLVEEKGINPEQIVLYGRSLGSGPSCYLAAKTASRDGRSVAGLILHSPFTSVYRVVFDVGLTLLGDKFPNIDRLAKVKCPVCIIHGQKDKIVPFEHGMALYETLPKQCRADPIFVENMTHNYHGYEAEVAVMEKLNHYLDYHILARRLWMKQPKKRRRSIRRAKNIEAEESQGKLRLIVE